MEIGLKVCTKCEIVEKLKNRDYGMKFDKFFNPKEKQDRLEVKIKKYQNAISDVKIKNLIDKMGYTEDTLKTIEVALEPYIKDAKGDTDHEKWNNLNLGIKEANKILNKKGLNSSTQPPVIVEKEKKD